MILGFRCGHTEAPRDRDPYQAFPEHSYIKVMQAKCQTHRGTYMFM